MRRAAAIAVTLAALAGGGCGGGSAAPQTATEEETPTGTFPNVYETVSRPSTPRPPAAPKTSPVRELTLVIRGGRPAGGIKKLEAKKGDRVLLTIRSDVADAVHVHGYDLKRDVRAGRTGLLAFTAKLAGVFEVELEQRAIQVAEIEVRP